MSKSIISQKKSFLDLTSSELNEILLDVGEKRFRIKQINNWIYNQNVRSWDEMINLPLSLIKYLKSEILLHPLKLVSINGSENDKTRKFLFQTTRGNHIESVLMREKNRTTVCVSSQSGCILDCNFCATASMGFLQNLNANEIIDQVILLSSYTKSKITNVVYMGMGEPFMNYRQVIESGKLLNKNMGLGARRITISTAGIAPKIRQIADDNYSFKLAISLNATNDEVRKKIMPITLKHSFKEIIDSAKYYYSKTKRLITFEYVLLNGINDSTNDAKELVKLLKGFPCKLNIIPYNEIGGDYIRPEIKDINQFLFHLKPAKFIVTVRWSNGTDIDAGCGQLAIREKQ
jgi:23S rRNA (adenine2503-C2)-methyltransferase|tara:strand:- start:539 stop:1579 length:1041 start_codon:yes stop_codon:yes gene_type:complete